MSVVLWVKVLLCLSYVLCFFFYQQQFSGTYVILLRHIIMIPSQPVFLLTPWFCLLSG
jgi:hypothetical protein